MFARGTPIVSSSVTFVLSYEIVCVDANAVVPETCHSVCVGVLHCWFGRQVAFFFLAETLQTSRVLSALRGSSSHL